MNPGSTFVLSVSALVLFVWGFFPHALMDKAARIRQRSIPIQCLTQHDYRNIHDTVKDSAHDAAGGYFMNPMTAETGGDAVAYFSPANLKGALISTLIRKIISTSFIVPSPPYSRMLSCKSVLLI